MILGFTGTQEGMSDAQLVAIEGSLAVISGIVTEVHHGGCVGADAEFHDLVTMYCKPKIIVHRGSSPRKWAPLLGEYTMLTPKDNLERNRDIIRASDRIWACPKGQEIMRSGTWATIRKSAQAKVPVVVVYPNGKTETR